MAVRIGSMVSLAPGTEANSVFRKMVPLSAIHLPRSAVTIHVPATDTGSACRLKGLCCDYIFYNFLPSSVHTDNRQRGVLMVGGRCDGSCLQPSGVDSVLIRCRMAEKISYIFVRKYSDFLSIYS